MKLNDEQIKLEFIIASGLDPQTAARLVQEVPFEVTPQMRALILKYKDYSHQNRIDMLKKPILEGGIYA